MINYLLVRLNLQAPGFVASRSSPCLVPHMDTWPPHDHPSHQQHHIRNYPYYPYYVLMSILLWYIIVFVYLHFMFVIKLYFIQVPISNISKYYIKKLINRNMKLILISFTIKCSVSIYNYCSSYSALFKSFRSK